MAERYQAIRFAARTAGLLLLACCFIALAGCGIATVKRADGPEFVPPQGEPLTGGAVLENERLKLAVEGENGTITVTDKRNGHVWQGAASKEQAAAQEVAGDYKGHVQSPFIVEYQEVGAKANTFKRGNVQSERPEVRLYRNGERIEVAFNLRNGDLRFSFLLGLSGSSLVVDIPGERIRDNPKTAVLKSIMPYPFLGAVWGKTKSGYMLVPSGPGYLIDFYDRNYPYDSAFNEIVYGEDLGVNLGSGSPMPVLYPVFGIKQDDNAFLAVLDRGGEYGKLSATPSGLNTPFNWAAAEFLYLPDDYLKNAYSTQAKQFIDDYMKREDRRMVYSFLAGEDADYVGMAKAYRTYLMETGGAKKLTPTGKEDPFTITVYQANEESGMLGRKAVPVTTFEEARRIVRTLYDKGVRSMNVALRGWNNGGEFPGGWPKRLPPEPSLGKPEELKALSDYAEAIGAPLLLYDNYFDATGRNAGFRPREDALRNLRTGVVEAKIGSFRQYRLRSEASLGYLRDALPAYGEWGISGLVLTAYRGKTVNSDFNKSGVSTRGQAIAAQQQMLDAIGGELGRAGIQTAYAYAVGHAQLMQGFQIGPGYDVFAGKTVPFYPMAVHGLAGYSGKEANLHPDPQADRLRQIEYGAIPAYIVTQAPASDLQYTSVRSTLVSSRFDIWQDEIVREYAKYRDSIGSAMHLFIENHRQLAEGVYATTYEDGRQVVVNYSDRPYRYASVDVPARDYAVVAAGSAEGRGPR
ncbi:hypothetical protein FE784_10575 [Paenibacillus hemerocallicola]|uniref:Uncharacterized protein n=1 Tax=Paenibacillus hemerocallicola TaxID=1172614 RepID=A0A5C4TBH2_9BACL|nr:DUF5696 domain-containing protein [Paenibacillus hemerocallicola]TNJ66413.1 hypothetical protein FE784_10575 [Paenibacillus hemerocallicola]